MFCIYKLRNPQNRGEYVGHTNDYDRRMREHRCDLTVECTDFEHEIVFDGIPTRAEANEMEKVFIDIHRTFDNGYNKTRGGRGTEVSEETKGKCRQAALQRVEDRTHPFIGGEIQRETNRRRVADGTHHFIGGESQREMQRQRVEDGTHLFLGGEIQHRRVADGTHNLLGGDVTRESNRNRIADGTHHFIGDSNPQRKKRLKAEWMWIRSLAMCWYEMSDYVVKRRQEFYNKDIPDTSQAEQIELF